MALCGFGLFAADKKVVRPPGAEPSASWSHGILVGDTLYISGMGGEDAHGAIPATFEAETRQALDNINSVLKAAGMSAEDVVSVQVYLTDVSTFEKMNAVYKAFFKDPRPTRTTVSGGEASRCGPHRDYRDCQEVVREFMPLGQ